MYRTSHCYGPHPPRGGSQIYVPARFAAANGDNLCEEAWTTSGPEVGNIEILGM